MKPWTGIIIPPENVYLCADNDKAGNDFTRRLQEKYPQMKRIAANDRYKDWNDMLRGIPKSTEIEQKKEEKETDMMLTYGNKVWNDATDNRDKTIISMHESNFQQFRDVLEHSGINYFAYAKEDSVIMAVNDKDIDWLRKLLSSDLDTRKSDKDYIPPEKNIIGNAEYRYIPQKEYVSADRDLILKMAELMQRENIQFSGRIYPTGKGTLTVSHNDLWKVRNIQKSVIDMRRQFSAAEKAQEIGNKDYRANRDTHHYMSKLTPEQFKEIKPFIETSVSYHAIARDGKVAFAVDKENAPAFHRALENAEREVDMLHSIQDLELPMEQMVALSPVIHRLAAEDVQLQLADFFDSRYDEAQFGEMLSLVNDYLNQPIAERYGEHSKLNDMLEAKSSFDRSIELSDFFSQHGFSDEQRAAITAMFVGDITRGQIDSIDKTFTVEDIRDYDEILHNALQESEITDFLAEHKQAVTDRENAAKEPTEEERVLFGQADLAMSFAECTLSSDEWEDMAYPLFENGYLDKHKPNDKGAFGYHLSEPVLYDLAYRYHNGEDIRKELALSLMEHKKTDDIEFVFENGKISDHTYYYAENLRNTLHADFGEDSVKCSFNGMEREVTYSEIGQAFLDRTFEEFNDIAFWWVRDDMTDEIPDISDEAIKQLIAAFDEHTMDGWEKGDNIPKLNRIKKALYDILGDEEQTEKAFVCIAKNKYNVTFEAEKPEKQPVTMRKVGDFYEMYGKNAEIGMEVLGLHNTPKNGSPMVGFPDHVKDEYSAKLGEAGYTVLIEQAFELNPPKREVQQLTTLQDVVDKYFGSDCEYAETDNGTWKITIADNEKAGEVFHNGEPVCGIYNRGDRMEVEPYDELSSIPKMVADAMLKHNPDKPVDIAEFNREFETSLDKAKYLINSFCEAEYDSEADFSDLHNVGIAYTTLTDDELPVQVTADLIDYKITYEFNGEVYNTEQYDSIDDMIKDGLTGLDFDSIISVPDEAIDRHTGEIEDRTTVYLSASAEDLAELREHLSLNGYDVKWNDDSLSFDAESEQIAYIESILEDRDIVYSLDGAAFDNPEQTVSLMSDVSEVSDFSSRKDDVKPVTLEFSGDRETLEDIKDKALSLGASASMDNVNGTLSIDTYDNHRDELETLAYKLGVLCKVKEEMISTDIDAPLFTDDAVIDEIQKNEHSSDNKPFWTESDLRGEQLSLFGDPVPMQTKQEQQKSSGRNRTDEDMKYLRNEIMRGTGFQGGKFRMKQFYDDNKPSVKDFAKKLKDEYGTGGHSGDGEVSFANHDSKGIQMEFNDGTSIDFSWNDAAKLAIELIENEQYITPDDIDRRKKDAKYTVENINPDTPNLYDQAMLEEAKAILKEYGIEAKYKPNDEPTEHISDTEKENSTPSSVSVGDRFRNKATGEVSEVVSLTGVLPWYTDQCTVSRASGGFVVTENVSYDKLLNTELYEYIDSGDIALEHTAPEAEVSDKNKVTPEKGNNFNITDTSLGEGGAKTKFKANIAAIETLKMLEKENRPATDEEKETLSKYVGWGGIPQAFDNDNDSWAAEYTQLKELLTPQEYRQANASVLDAFYTSPTVIDGIYEALENFGFEVGNVLEPAMGVGNFFGRMPEKMQKNSQLYGVEIDSISGRIAQKLYPDADIAIQGFEKNNFQNGCFDVAVGNVPFGELSFKDDKHGTTKLHDYFFAETLDKVKDGGIVAFVTSAGTLDKRDETTRQMLSDKADFIGAIRLPGGKNGAFKDNAGTEVTTDIIFLQKHNDKTVKEMLDVPDWVRIGETADGLPINKYFEQNPDMVLGTVVEGNKLYGSGTMVVADDGFDLQTALHDAVSKLSAQISMDNARDVYAKSEDGIDVKIPSNLRNYSFFMSDDQVYFKKNNVACDLRFANNTAQHGRFKAFIELRDTTRDLLEAQELDKPNSVITDLQKQLNTSYDNFYKKYGLIHSQTNKRYFSEDISYNLVAGLEKSYDKNVLKEKSDIFTKRTIIPPKAVDHVETALEALTLSVSEKAQIDFEYMEKLTGMTEDELKHDLTGEIFKVPHTVNDYQTASEYLSGDIRARLRETEEIAEYDADFNINVSALKSVMPEPLKAGDIDVKIGATWLDPKYYEQFMYELLQTPQFQQSNSPAARWNKSSIIGVEYSDHSNSWHISNKSSDKSVLATQKYGSHKMNAYDILEHILNLKEPKVYKTIEVPDDLGDVKEKRIVDIDATRVVQRKAEDIRKAFKNWIFKDSTRREDIVNRYNELFNSIRPREFDGSALSFPMMNSDIKLHDHQKNAIAHAMFGGNTLFAHSVGAGKTFEMIATAMESKRLGLCTKSLFAVPNHLTDQIGNDFQKLYPSANILVATKKDFKKENRQQLFAKIATGNYDAVIIGHSQLGMIPVSKERQVATIQSQIDDILLGIDELKRQEGSKFQIKAMERTRKSLQKQLDKLDKNHDDTITFEQLGVDKLFIDEAHECTTRS